MITTLTPNPCLDRTLSVERFELEKMNRAQLVRTDISGKGINVSLALHGLRISTACIGFSFSEDAPAMRDLMEKKGIPFDFAELPGKLRTCTKIFDRSRKHTIEINEFGPEVRAEDGDRLIDLVVRYAAKSSCLTLSGSLPPGMGKDFYFRCASAAKQTAPDCRIVVDAEKTLLLEALKAAPFLIKPNIHEFQATFGTDVHSPRELDREARKILKHYSLGLLCVSLGGEGAYITDGRASYFCPALRTEVRSVQGAGDSLVAGLCMALEQGCSLPDILHCGVAAAGDSISREGTQLCTFKGFRQMLKQDVQIQKIF